MLTSFKCIDKKLPCFMRPKKITFSFSLTSFITKCEPVKAPNIKLSSKLCLFLSVKPLISKWCQIHDCETNTCNLHIEKFGILENFPL